MANCNDLSILSRLMSYFGMILVTILTNLTTREEDLVYYVYHNGRTILLTKPL